MELNYEQQQDLSFLTREVLALSNKSNRTKQDVQRESVLMGAMAAIKAGASLRDMQIDEANRIARKAGTPTIKRSRMTLEQQYQARAWQYLVREHRTDTGMTEGAPMLSHIGTYAGLGFFVPNDFYPTLYSAMAAHDVLFNEEDCTVIKTENGRVLPIPLLGDIEKIATVVGESSSRTISSIADTNHAPLGVYTYDSGRWPVSIEAVQDLQGALSISNLALRCFSSRLARGISKDLLTGDASGSQPLGLLTALSNIGVPPVTALGSSANTGGTETGANSIGSIDFANLVADLDSAYLDSPKAAFIMNRNTLGAVNAIVDKVGHPANIVQYVDGKPFILGIPVKISPSMENIGPSNIPVILGDFSYWATRLVMADDNVGLMVYRQDVGLIENGIIELASFCRAGGALLYHDSGSPAPFAILRCHS
jgi:HK97 family phage major capsid protein